MIKQCIQKPSKNMVKQGIKYKNEDENIQLDRRISASIWS
jgi:hypothetical protein